MDQENPYSMAPGEADLAVELPPQTGKLAVASLVCGLVFCCPLTTLLAPILGLAHFITAKGKPWVRGAGLAVGGMLLGLVFSAGWIFIAWGTAQVIAQMTNVPREALMALSAGDLGAFKTQWIGLDEGPETTAEIAAFGRAVRGRYGMFVDLRLDDQTERAPEATGLAYLPFLVVFRPESGPDVEVSALAGYAPTGNGLEMKLAELTFFDAELGDLVFPDSDFGAAEGAWIEGLDNGPDADGGAADDADADELDPEQESQDSPAADRG